MRKTRKCRHGTFTWYTQDYYVAASLEVTGEYSPAELDRMHLLVPPTGCAVMAGANIGTLAVPMARHLANGVLFAFEPEPVAHDLLLANLEQNGLDLKIAWRAAAGSRVGKARLAHADYTADTWNSGSGRITDSTFGTVEVDMITIDSLRLERLDLLHADTEGSELSVIRGAELTIRRHRPFLYVENNHRDRSADLIHAIRQLGYECRWHLPMLYNPDPAGGLLLSANMLCVPFGKPVPDGALDATFEVLSEDELCDDAFRRFMERKR